MIIECGPCRLRAWVQGDELDLLRVANNPNVARHLRDAFPSPYTIRDAAGWIRFASGLAPITELAIEVEGRPAGGIGMRRLEDIERVSAEVGYWLGEPYWGQGIATAALRKFVEYAFGLYPLSRLFALPFADNTASIRVLEKAGFVREGTLRRSAIKEGRLRDQALYALVTETNTAAGLPLPP